MIEVVAYSLSFSPQFVAECAGSSPWSRSFYRRVSIPKKNKPNERRIIYLPSPEIKLMQHFLVERYISKLPVHGSATAYRRGSSVVKNAKAHTGNSHFLLMDIESFFDSIQRGRVKRMLLNNGVFVNPADAEMLISLCTYDGHFVQGCVSSPSVANAYLYEFDNKMDMLARGLPNGVYTRYSDDIVLSSSERIPGQIAAEVAAALAEFGLRINHKKTHFISNRQRIHITGIRLKDNKKLGLNTLFKKELKNDVYQFWKKCSLSGADLKDKNRLYGKLAYLKMADPSYYNTIITKYRFGCRTLLDFLHCLVLENDHLMLPPDKRFTDCSSNRIE
ncbi:MAG: RNA-directed DNA polymerase [Bacilli bacterium]|nr:RNA-directed DNA polymerase [Bacilli bacterium]